MISYVTSALNLSAIYKLNMEGIFAYIYLDSQFL